KAEVIEFMEMQWGTFGYRTVSESLVGLFNKRLVPVLLKEAGIDQQPNLLCQDLTWKTKERFYRTLKDWRFRVIDTNDFTNAQVTAGGIDTTELVEGSLESKLVP